jgi:hypothetical protein
MNELPPIFITCQKKKNEDARIMSCIGRIILQSKEYISTEVSDLEI